MNDIARVNGQWFEIEQFCQYRIPRGNGDPYSKNRREYTQASEVWMDGKPLFRLVAPREGPDDERE